MRMASAVLGFWVPHRPPLPPLPWGSLHGTNWHFAAQGGGHWFPWQQHALREPFVAAEAGQGESWWAAPTLLPHHVAAHELLTLLWFLPGVLRKDATQREACAGD
jgi:hypothetical protein